MEDRDGNCGSLIPDTPLTSLRPGDIFDHPLRMPIGLMCTCLWVKFFCDNAGEERLNVGYLLDGILETEDWLSAFSVKILVSAH